MIAVYLSSCFINEFDKGFFGFFSSNIAFKKRIGTHSFVHPDKPDIQGTRQLTRGSKTTY
jgi:hypothetical protein